MQGRSFFPTFWGLKNDCNLFRSAQLIPPTCGLFAFGGEEVLTFFEYVVMFHVDRHTIYYGQHARKDSEAKEEPPGVRNASTTSAVMYLNSCSLGGWLGSTSPASGVSLNNS